MRWTAVVATLASVVVARAHATIYSAIYNRTANEIDVEPCVGVTLTVEDDVVSLICADSLFTRFDQQISSSGYVTINFHPRNEVNFGRLKSNSMRALSMRVDAPKDVRVKMDNVGLDFRSLSAMRDISFDQFEFYDQYVELPVTSTLETIVIRSTTMRDLSLKVEGDSQLGFINFGVRATLDRLPKVLYERKYKRSLEIPFIAFVTASPVQKLSKTEFENARANLVARAATNITCYESCSRASLATTGVLSVCPDSSLKPKTSMSADAERESSGISTAAIIGIVVAGVVVVGVLIACFVTRRSRSQRSSKAPAESSPTTTQRSQPLMEKTESTDADATFARYQTNESVRMASQASSDSALVAQIEAMLQQDEIERVRLSMTQLRIDGKLSHGAFGEVYKGRYDRQEVAIKRLAPKHRTNLRHVQCFLSEAKLMAAMRHDRIIAFIGVGWNDPMDVHVVTEFMSGGDLRGLLQWLDSQSRPTGFDLEKLKIALHIAEALAYLHSRRPQVLHRDLKSRNVLLSSTLDAKLIDFGVSRERVDQTMTEGVGTVRWMAPEVMTSGRYGASADIFSFGVVLSELDTHMLPYDRPGMEPLPNPAVVTQVTINRLQVTFTEDETHPMVVLARECMAFEASDRPKTSAVLKRMRLIYAKANGEDSDAMDD
ncbi:hypothetical protein PINS_up020459 [Pythium insidiosum]|nr:hypothetical protein PINS_up020459 [Pythium insidiosum]